MQIRALLVDDESLARAKIRKFLETETDIEIVAECANGQETLEVLRKQPVDLLFLDIQMPGLSGFDVLEKLNAEQMPVIIFITAYDQYALKAFEFHALDYLLKPFDRERFSRSLSRAREHIRRRESGRISERLLALLEDLQGKPKPLERLVTKSNGRIFFLRTEEIDWIEAEGNYVRLHVGNESHLLRETMLGLEAKLDPQMFVRIHRSTMVNLERIRELQPWFRGDYVVILKDGKQLTLSRGYRDRLEALLGKSL